jgi:hypothetical protein
MRAAAACANLVAAVAPAGCFPSLAEYYPDDAGVVGGNGVDGGGHGGNGGGGDGGAGGGRCANFSPVETLAEQQVELQALAIQYDVVYFLNGSPPRLSAVEKHGRRLATVLLDSNADYGGIKVLANARDLASEGGRVYWLASTDQGASIAASCDVHGEGLHVKALQGRSGADHLALDSTNVYWTFADRLAYDDGVYKCPIDEATENCAGIFGKFEQIAAVPVPLALAIGRIDAFFTSAGDGTAPPRVKRTIKSGLGASEVIDDHGTSFGIATDASGTYFTTDLGDIRVWQNGRATTLTSKRDMPTAIALDDESVYWVERHGVMCIGKSGGQPVELASSGEPYDIAVDGSGVYWTDRATQRVHTRHRRP